jgi:bacterioferritin
LFESRLSSGRATRRIRAISAKPRAPGGIAAPVGKIAPPAPRSARMLLDVGSKQEAAMNPFTTDLEEIRRRARSHIEQGAVTENYRADRPTVIKLLNEALATEIVCVLRYKRHYFMAKGMSAEAVRRELLEHAAEEQQHADRLAERITQLDGEPNFDPQGLATRSHSDYEEGKSLVEMVRADLVAERIAIDSYAEIIRYVGDQDPTTRRLLEDILAKEEEHANDLADLLANAY